ncbi:MAG: class 1 fructose-bisphosphatase [Saprospiraceae bacterium]|nr:class 1 fructose-bisphosphatase [Saprospiraceae bacterium]MBK9221459.1 class 1 fructose-bisphosphatase [Saprospiraceae bacterium]MBK9721603.1 class 1 fructose-bisphosphatase [Saprospiraceae bacterium]
MSRRITLDEFIVQNQALQDSASGEFTGLLRHIGIAAKIVNRVVNKAGLMDILGEDGNLNSSGDTVQKLDIYANDLMIEYLRNSGLCAGVASEELDEFISFTTNSNHRNKYIVVIDPLDGSSNIDVNISVGTIFGIYKRLTAEDQALELDDFLQKGTEQVAAGYILYGTSTMLIYTSGFGVNGFTYDRGIGEFCLSHKNMRIPESGNNYSINQGYYRQFNSGIQQFLNQCADHNMMLRYIGSMVADVHRTICLGGVFLYPQTIKNPQGKLRMLYECSPISFVVEQAGGMSVDESGKRIMDTSITSLHQRSSIIIGSVDNVKEVLKFI